MFSRYFLEKSPFFHLSQENLSEVLLFFLQVNKDMGRCRKFGTAGTVAVQGLKLYQICSVQMQSEAEDK